MLDRRCSFFLPSEPTLTPLPPSRVLRLLFLTAASPPSSEIFSLLMSSQLACLLALGGGSDRFGVSRRIFSLSLRISTSILHSTARRTSSRA